MTIKHLLYLLFSIAFFLHATGCDDSGKSQAETQLLIYCGITMIKPISEIAEIIEKQEDCKILITKGGSGNLLKSIKVNGVGDLYLPGSDSYIKTCLEEGLVSDTAHVGYNKAALMVQKGNPKGFNSDLDNLKDPRNYVVIGNPDSGSVGKETKKILDKKGIFKDVAENARKLTTDSKDLVTVIRNKEADLVINWYATSTWKENKSHVDAIPIDERFAKKKKLVMGLLKTSRNPEIAGKFMAYAASSKGREIFNRYGLYDVR